jgi:pSer/pThr/pTyr-binding forkhead associated (FHA) protein
MKAQILYRSRRAALQTFRLSADESILGRDPGLAVSIPREGISRHHARVLRDARGFVLEDLKSTNGTFLNGRAVTRERMRHLDVIGLGREVELVFLVREAPSAPIRKRVIAEAALRLEGPEPISWPVPAGEVTLGRSSACNIILESSAISKVHARVVRSAEQLVVEDLGSSNGTFVNGRRVMTAPLEAGDVISLGGVANLSVSLERGEITVLSGERMPLEAAEGPPTERRRFSVDWRTRYEWDSGEREQLAALQRELAEQDALRKAQAEKKGATAKPGVPAPKAAPPAKASAPAAKPAAAKAVPPAAAKPAAAAAPPAAGPAAAKQPPQPPATPTGAPPSPAVAKPQAPPPAAKPAAPPPAPQVPRQPAPPVPSPAPPVVHPPAPAAASPAKSEPAPAGRRIVELRLTGGGFDLVALETGAHDLGRAKDAALRIDSQTVSRQHARIIISDDRTVAYVQDRGGANGTFLNGAPVDKLKLVKEGDVIGLGEIKLKVSIRRE